MAGSGKLEGGDVRVSDRDRNKIAAELRVHWLDGRITVEELEWRIEQTMSARTTHELAEVVYDLPTVSVPTERPERPVPVRVGPPGIRPFTRRIVAPARMERTRAAALDKIAPGLNGFGYELKSQSPTGLEFVRTARPAGAGLIAILLFPFGLLALLARNKERIVISFENTGSNETTMIIHGRASRGVRKAFAKLNFS